MHVPPPPTPPHEGGPDQVCSDLPLEEHPERVLPEAWLLLEDLLLENEPFAIPTILLQSFADKIQTGWWGKK